ncbi:hypothetical protein H5154_03675 [Pseudoalteromonas sp. SR44-5]|uniref:hypothetical protein n=1 Tax=Pseudoalteromonas TaxID=53246 RepID=UPI0015FEDBA1|nr:MULTISPECIES: hypothetical protein [Pseudoalteromonas]MBB1291778.1 hypothetical protein [Pseudoalteromonas sp. SR41-4]MBB1308444.1 hypothetical protein [Pseudoalteromonas sp. SR41-8]MBB1365487.1 hypothetical protein [Pseudoalteromonas sp. SR44-5]MBB1407684.1 hypothetical protein [Pseudoalteromonas sp. SG44-17]MBB1504016.1 hypothetical protein [Pseudoalteromonas sp. SG41-1]|tara:strand:- start:2915 stop:3346 length:432 start_codon:yes stop_codon:yes gene_type:complete
MNLFLLIAGSLSALAALAHLGCIVFGAPWYRFFGAGEHMAMLAEQGKLTPSLITFFIAFVLSVWSLYAFSAAGLFKQLPFIRFVLVVVTAIYLFRGIAGLYLMTNPLGRSEMFWLWSSIICLLIGGFHFIGLKQQWLVLSVKY